MENGSVLYCQSCCMPLTEKEKGTEIDGSKSNEYCIYCYKGGNFLEDSTMEEMIESCVPYVSKGDPWPDAETARKEMRAIFPTLKRWRNKES